MTVWKSRRPETPALWRLPVPAPAGPEGGGEALRLDQNANSIPTTSSWAMNATARLDAVSNVFIVSLHARA